MTPVGEHGIELLWALAQREDVLSDQERAMLALALTELEQRRARAGD